MKHAAKLLNSTAVGLWLWPNPFEELSLDQRLKRSDGSGRKQRGLHRPRKPRQRTERFIHGGGLVTRLNHAVHAFGIATFFAVARPGGRFHQLVEGAGITVLQQI